MLSTMDWRTQAIGAYHWTRGKELDRMRDEVAAQILRLTGRPIAPEAIAVDREWHVAKLTLDGVRFHVQRRRVVVVRPCVVCGTRHLESDPVADEVDLGYALCVWEPRCRHCPVEELAGATA